MTDKQMKLLAQEITFWAKGQEFAQTLHIIEAMECNCKTGNVNYDVNGNLQGNRPYECNRCKKLKELRG